LLVSEQASASQLKEAKVKPAQADELTKKDQERFT
jgi:hypothetical protein